MVVFASWPRTFPAHCIPTDDHSTIINFYIILNYMNKLACRPLAKAYLKIFAHWEGVQQKTPVYIVADSTALQQWPVDRTPYWRSVDT